MIVWCVFACAHVYVCDVWMCLYVHMCGGQKLASAVSEFLFSLFCETESPTETGAL